MIELNGTIGIIIFFIILICMELFFIVIGRILSNLIGLTGWMSAIFIIGVFIILNIIFVDIK